MPRKSTVKTSIVVLLIALLYRYWLVTPVLQYVSIGKWYLVAIVVAAASGCAMSLLRLPPLAWVGASMAGPLVTGNLASWKDSNKAPDSPCGVFWGDLGSLSV